MLAAATLALAPLPRPLVERTYSNGFYGWLQSRLTAASDVVPWAVLDGLVMALGAFLVWGVARAWRARPWRTSPGRARSWRDAGLARWLAHRAARGGCVVAAGYLAFLLLWGLNYRREPVESRLSFDATRVTPAGVLAIALGATDALNGLHGPAHARRWPELEDLPAGFGPVFTRTTARLGLSWTPRPGRPKPTLLAPYFRWAAVAGFTNPFGLEVVPGPDTLPFERHAVMAHEWAHLAGFAHEAEAGFVGWMACLAGDAQARYSGWMSVWPSLVAALPAPDRQRVVRALGPGPRADFRAMAARSRLAVPVVRDAAWRGYDAYLRSQRVREGVASYEGVVRLMAGSGLALPRGPASLR